MHRPRILASFLASLILLWVGGCASVSHPEISLVPSRITLPSDRVLLPTWKGEGGRLYVDVKINGAGPFKLEVDSGCSALMLTRRAATGAGIQIEKDLQGRFRNADGNYQELSFARVERLESAGMVLEDFYAGVVPDSITEGFDPDAVVDGAMGMSVFANLVLELDLPSAQVAVNRVGSTTFDAARAVTVTPGQPIVVADVGGTPVRMLVDTAANDAFDVPSLEGLPLVGPKAKWTGASGVAGTASVVRPESGQLAGDIRVGGITWERPPLRTTTRDRGRIGLAALRLWTVAFDQSGGRLYLLGDPAKMTWQPVAEYPGKVIGVFMIIDGRKVRVLDVDPGGLADRAGLKAGDVIVAMDGRPGMSEGFMAKPTRLRVWRDGVEFETTLEVAEASAPAAN